MPERKRVPNIPTGRHTPVSNEPEDETEFFMETALSEAPSEGPTPHTGKANDDGTEAVEGRRKKNPSAMSELFAVPDALMLRNLREASSGEPHAGTESVHGPDNRVQINNTEIYPWRVHASLLITTADNSLRIGTGWFIGPHTVMTAGHQVYVRDSNDPGGNGWVKSIDVMPGRNGKKLPYGSVKSTSFRSVKGWTEDGNEDYNYGAIILPTNLGNTVGWFGFGVYSDRDLVNTTGNLSGYPGDKPGGTQWYDSHHIASVTSRRIYYDIDTSGGQSGSAVYRIRNGGRYAVAIHNSGRGTFNSGCRIVTPVFTNMVNWKK